MLFEVGDGGSLFHAWIEVEEAELRVWLFEEYKSTLLIFLTHTIVQFGKSLLFLCLEQVLILLDALFLLLLHVFFVFLLVLSVDQLLLLFGLPLGLYLVHLRETILELLLQLFFVLLHSSLHLQSSLLWQESLIQHVLWACALYDLSGVSEEVVAMWTTCHGLVRTVIKRFGRFFSVSASLTNGLMLLKARLGFMRAWVALVQKPRALLTQIEAVPCTLSLLSFLHEVSDFLVVQHQTSLMILVQGLGCL